MPYIRHCTYTGGICQSQGEYVCDGFCPRVTYKVGVKNDYREATLLLYSIYTWVENIELAYICNIDKRLV